MTLFIVLSSWLRAITRVDPVHLINAGSAPDRCQPGDQAKQLGLQVCQLAATIHIHHRHCYYYSAKADTRLPFCGGWKT